jgi:hypothetical protein
MSKNKPEPVAELCVELNVEMHELIWEGVPVWVTGKMTVRLDDVLEFNTPEGQIVVPRTLAPRTSERIQ